MDIWISQYENVNISGNFLITTQKAALKAVFCVWGNHLMCKDRRILKRSLESWKNTTIADTGDDRIGGTFRYEGFLNLF